MLLLGKHQFIVSDVTSNDGMTTSYASDPKTSSDKTRWYAKLIESSCSEMKGAKPSSLPRDEVSYKDSEESLNDLVGNANDLLKALSAINQSINTADDRWTLLLSLTLSCRLSHT
jgi:hypothetical protein